VFIFQHASYLFSIFMLSIYIFLNMLLNCLVSLCLLFIYFSTCFLIVFSFSMQVIEQYERRQGGLVELA
jgi:hypothetical protein